MDVEMPSTASTLNERDNTAEEITKRNDNVSETVIEQTTGGTTVHWYSVNTYMLPAKIAYFVNGARFEISDYFMLFYISTGLSPFEAGLLNGLQYLGSMVGNPLWGLLADRKGYRRFIMIFLCVMGIITAAIQPFFAYLFGDKENNVCPVMHNISTTTSTEPSYYVITNKKDITDRRLFYAFLICAILFASFEGSISSFVDAGILGRVQTSPRKAEIGKQRLCSSIGSSLGSIAFSASITYFPHSQMSCYVGVFITYFIFAVSTAICGFPLYNGISIHGNNQRREGVLKHLLLHLKDFDVLFFLSNVLFTGIFQGILFSFLFVYLKELNAPTMLFGISISFNSISSVIVYSLSDRFIRVLVGPQNAICVSCFAWGIRFLCTALLINPYYILILDLFHGFTYSLSKVSALQHVSETAPKSIFTTMCGINNLLFISCGFLIASMFGGKMYQEFGGKKMYIGSAITCFTWGFVNVVYLLSKRLRRREIAPIPSN